MKMQSSVTFVDEFLKINMIKTKILQSEGHYTSECRGAAQNI